MFSWLQRLSVATPQYFDKLPLTIRCSVGWPLDCCSFLAVHGWTRQRFKSTISLAPTQLSHLLTSSVTIGHHNWPHNTFVAPIATLSTIVTSNYSVERPQFAPVQTWQSHHRQRAAGHPYIRWRKISLTCANRALSRSIFAFPDIFPIDCSLRYAYSSHLH